MIDGLDLDPVTHTGIVSQCTVPSILGLTGTSAVSCTEPWVGADSPTFASGLCSCSDPNRDQDTQPTQAAERESAEQQQAAGDQMGL